MTASLSTQPSFAPALGHSEAIYFASGEHTLFGWIHRPSAECVNRTGLLICQPFGYEAVCSHRSMRSFAEAAATLGLPTLRFDYLGTGDSADIDPRADQMDLWLRDVIAAIAELQRQTGVEQVCLLGFRLGALLATLVASKCKAVTSLIVVAPILNGRRYLRELRTTRLASSLSVGNDEMAKTSLGQGSMEVCGFPLSAATIETLAQISLTGLAAPQVSDILVIDRSELPAARVWTEAMSGLGIRTEYLTLPGFSQMMMTPPQFAVVPKAMIEAMTDWLLRFEREWSRQPVKGIVSPGNSSTPQLTIMPLGGDSPGLDPRLTEQPVLFGCGADLFGIVTEPCQNEKRRGAVILINSGAEYHVGTNRMYVSLARRWARGGYVVLRMDLAGIGDSGKRVEQPDDEIFPPTALDDIRAAIDYICARYGASDITLGGLCSGAYHALRAAVAGLSVNRILMINPQNFFWKQGATLKDLQLAEVVRNPVVYRDRVFSAMAWRRLLTGRVNVWRLAAVYVLRILLALESALRDLARRLGIRLTQDLGRELEEIVARGIDTIFVFAHGDPGIYLLKLQAGSSLSRLGERLRVHIVHGTDHNFSHSGPRALMELILSDELFAQKQRAGTALTASASSPIAQAQVHKFGTH